MQKIMLSQQQRSAVQRIELDMLMELDRICRKHDIQYTLGYGTLIGAVRHKGFIPWDDDVDVCMLRSDYEKFREICKTELDQKYFYQTNETDSAYFHLFDKIRANDTVFRETFLAKHPIHHGVYIDIFPLDYIPDSAFKRKVQFYKFHFYRTGLMSKYLMINARHGKKKYAAMLLRVLYAPLSLKFLYDGACRTASRYNESPETDLHSFCSPYKMRDVFDRKIFADFIKVPFEDRTVSIIENYDCVLKSIYGDYRKLPPAEQQKTQHDLVELKV